MRDKNFELNETTLPIIQQLSEHMPGGFFIYHAHGGEEFILVNRAMLRLTGCADIDQFKSLTGNSFRGFVHPDDLDRTEREIMLQIQNDELGYDYVEYRILCADGSVKWIRDYGRFAHTKPYGDVYYVFVDDATSQHEKELQLQIALEEQESQLQEITALNEELTKALNNSSKQ